MEKHTFFWQLAGFFFTSIFGVIFHFLYEWSNQNVFIAPFAATDESIWQHMKILFFPMFFFALIERPFVGNRYENFWSVKLRGSLIGIALIPILYYSYTGIFGQSVDWINIAIFFTAAAVVYLLLYHPKFLYLKTHDRGRKITMFLLKFDIQFFKFPI